MTDKKLALIRAKAANVRRYRLLLQTQLTELERDYVHRRLNEEQDALAAATSKMQPPLTASVGSNQSQQVAFETSHA
jgi:hypothetical protein